MDSYKLCLGEYYLLPVDAKVVGEDYPTLTRSESAAWVMSREEAEAWKAILCPLQMTSVTA